MNTLWRQANLASWNNRAALHIRDTTGFYDVEGFLNGRDTLCPIEGPEVGDVTGKRLLHLQCHFGLDTLSLARRGALVTGLDFSPVAIEGARDLAAKAGLPATFVQADLYEAREAIEGRFDMVYTSWGTICWLPDIRAWARVVADMLEPGGTFYFADSHPFALVLDERDGAIRPTFGWRTPKDRPDAFTEAKSYTGDDFAEPITDYNWLHPLSDIVTSLIEAGLTLEFLHEHERLPWQLFPSMVPTEDRMFRLPDGAVPMPLAVSLRAVKREDTLAHRLA